MSQVDQILAHLRNEPITPMQALMNYGCFRLAARIKDLRDSGHKIHTERVEFDERRFARYSLIKEAQ